MKQLLIFLFLTGQLCYAKAEGNIVKDDIHYKASADEIILMLQGKQKLDFKRAVFLLENAYYGGKLNYETFRKQIDDIKTKLYQIKKRAPIPNENMKNNWAVFSYMVDSIKENNFKPYQYDLKKFYGRQRL